MCNPLHEPLAEAVTQVVDRCGRLLQTLEKAGNKVGGLDLKKSEPERESR